jgi:hypothetical protein
MQLRVPDTMTGGATVQCPQCRATFQLPLASDQPPVPSSEPAAAPPPVSTDIAARPTAPPDWRDDPAHPGEPRDPYQRRAGGFANEYSIDLSLLFNQASAHYSAVLGPMVGYCMTMVFIGLPVLIVMGAIQLIPILGPLLNTVITAAVFSPLAAGPIIVTLAQYQGREWTFADFFGGFRYWTPLFVNGLIINLIGFACALPAEALNLAAGNHPTNELLDLFSGRAGRNPAQADAALTALAGLCQIMGSLVVMVVTIRHFLFCQCLIVDRGCSATEAIHGSTALARGHFWGWLGTMIVVGFIGGIGVLACGFGLLFTIPYSWLLTTSGYLLAVGSGRPPEYRDY